MKLSQRKETRLVVKFEKDIIADHLSHHQLDTPPAGFTTLVTKDNDSERLIGWKIKPIINRSTVFEGIATGNRYFVMMCCAKDESSGMLELISIDTIFQR